MNPAPKIVDYTVIWFSNSSINSKFYSNSDTTHYMKLVNSSILSPLDCRIFINNPKIHIRAIPNILISDIEED